MSLSIVQYGHPVLRQKGASVETLDEDLQRLVDEMFATMHAAAGIGLAAQQIGRAINLTVIDVREVTDRPSFLEIDGQPVPVEEFMPLVLVNPKIEPVGEPATGPEGCLSFPEIYADITRPEFVEVTAQDRHGAPLRFKAGGLLARVIQHEVDHLNGILFIDRMTSEAKEQWKPTLEAMRRETQKKLQQQQP